MGFYLEKWLGALLKVWLVDSLSAGGDESRGKLIWQWLNSFVEAVYKTPKVVNFIRKLQVILQLSVETKSILLSLPNLANKLWRNKSSLPEAQLKFLIIIQPKESQQKWRTI